MTVTSPSNHGVAEASGGGVLGVTTLDDSVSKMTFHLVFTAGDGYELTKPGNPPVDETVSIGGSSSVEYELKETGGDTGSESDPDAEKTGVKSGEIKLYASAFRAYVNDTADEQSDDIVFTPPYSEGGASDIRMGSSLGSADKFNLRVQSEPTLSFSLQPSSGLALESTQMSGASGDHSTGIEGAVDAEDVLQETVGVKNEETGLILVQTVTVQPWKKHDDSYGGNAVLPNVTNGAGAPVSEPLSFTLTWEGRVGVTRNEYRKLYWEFVTGNIINKAVPPGSIYTPPGRAPMFLPAGTTYTIILQSTVNAGADHMSIDGARFDLATEAAVAQGAPLPQGVKRTVGPPARMGMPLSVEIEGPGRSLHFQDSGHWFTASLTLPDGSVIALPAGGPFANHNLTDPQP